MKSKLLPIALLLNSIVILVFIILKSKVVLPKMVNYFFIVICLLHVFLCIIHIISIQKLTKTNKH